MRDSFLGGLNTWCRTGNGHFGLSKTPLLCGIANCNLKFRKLFICFFIHKAAAPFLSGLFGFTTLETTGKSQQGRWESLFHGIMIILQEVRENGNLGQTPSNRDGVLTILAWVGLHLDSMEVLK